MNLGLRAKSARLEVARAGWLVGAAIYAALAFFSGIDRASLIRPELARLVPRPFAANAKIVSAQQTLERRDYRGAASLAADAVRAAPVDAASTALLGGARLGQADEAGAEQAFQVAGNFGWRTPLTQYYWMRRALEVGDYHIASLRLDALLRGAPELTGDAALMALLESTAEGRSALAERLAANPDWVRSYTQDVYGLTASQADIRADVLNQVAAKGARLGCEAVGPLTRLQVGHGAVGSGFNLWQSHCHGRVSGLLANLDFSGLQPQPPNSPFDWTLIADSDVSINIHPGLHGNGRLLIASSAPFPRKVLMQLVMLPPGRYRLSWEASEPSVPHSTRIAAFASCSPDARPIEGRPLVSGQRMYLDFEAAADCPARWIGFMIAPGVEQVTFGKVSLQPLD